MSKKVKGPSDYQQWERNLAVWGQMATGGGHPTERINECPWSSCHEQK